MKEFHFYGESDDVFGYEFYTENLSWGGDEHDNCANGSIIAFKLTSGNDGLIVTGHYAPKPIPGATWIVGVSLLDEDKPLPNWRMRYETHTNQYSPRLIIECPNDVVVEDITNAA